MVRRSERKLRYIREADDREDRLITTDGSFSLHGRKRRAAGTDYRIEDEDGIIWDSWIGFDDDDEDAIRIFNKFMSEETVEDDDYDQFDRRFDDEFDNDSDFPGYDDYGGSKSSRFGDDDDTSGWIDRHFWRNSSNQDSYSYPTYHYEPPKKRTGFFDEFTKSDTLVFHRTDPSTIMLSQVYEGKGWDVINGTSDLDTEELFRVVDAHKRIVCLGHGTPGGLSGMFGQEMAPHLKDKKIFAIWCNADAYFLHNKIGQGQFITGNMPSEVWECRAAGCGNISRELMLENITYWSKLCADVAERCLNGDVRSSVDYIRKNYLEKYGNHPVTIYNSERTQCLGESQPLPKYQFKGEPLEGEDIPYKDYNEQEFLANPTDSVPQSYTNDWWEKWKKEHEEKYKSSTSTKSEETDDEYDD